MKLSALRLWQRAVLPLCLLAVAVAAAGPLARAQGLPTPAAPAEQPAAEEGVLTHELLGQWLTDMGYEHELLEDTTGKMSIYNVSFKQGTFQFIFYMVLSPDSSRLYINAPLKIIPEGMSVSADPVLRLLSENWAIAPMMFTYDSAGRQFYLSLGVENRDMSKARIRDLLNDMMGTMRRTEPLWTVRTWPTAEAPAAPAAETPATDTPAATTDAPAAEAPAGDAPAAPVSDARLEGRWQVVSWQDGNTKLASDQISGVAVTFSGNTVTFTQNGLSIGTGTFSADSAQNPATIDLKVSGMADSIGIYSLDGETLTLCMARQADAGRPAEVATGESTLVIVLRRAA
jgi:uncharacterized protein (TIGR03067 family)